MCKKYLFYLIIYLFFGIMFIYVNNIPPKVHIRSLNFSY